MRHHQSSKRCNKIDILSLFSHLLISHERASLPFFHEAVIEKLTFLFLIAH